MRAVGVETTARTQKHNNSMQANVFSTIKGATRAVYSLSNACIAAAEGQQADSRQRVRSGRATACENSKALSRQYRSFDWCRTIHAMVSVLLVEMRLAPDQWSQWAASHVKKQRMSSRGDRNRYRNDQDVQM
jgi:hypothetical protein